MIKLLSDDFQPLVSIVFIPRPAHHKLKLRLSIIPKWINFAANSIYSGFLDGNQPMLFSLMLIVLGCWILRVTQEIKEDEWRSCLCNSLWFINSLLSYSFARMFGVSSLSCSTVICWQMRWLPFGFYFPIIKFNVSGFGCCVLFF